MTRSPKDQLKQVLANIPFAARTYWRLFERSGPTLHLRGHNSLDRLEKNLPLWCTQASKARQHAPHGKQLLIFATFRYWIEHATLLGLTLAGLGHDVTLIYLPYARYKIPTNRFDLQRQDAYLESVLNGTTSLIKVVSLFNERPLGGSLPPATWQTIEEISLRDTQYSTRMEDVDRKSELYQLRLSRNEFAARVALRWLQDHPPDIMIIPNGSVLEYGVLYQVARHLSLPVITYEFDEPRYRIRLARDAEVMREDTNDFWQARRGFEFTHEQWEQTTSLMAARQGGRLWENFSVQFQGIPRQGEDHVRRELGLDERPIVLLAPNVFGDSATLDRQVFSISMSEWLERTVHYFTRRSDVQLVIRIHPSETRFSYGTSMAEVVQETMPNPPENIHLIPANATVNTYDLVEMADLGLVYTTTIGMEMAMSGVPVIVAGYTHYRGKGFTLDPESWDDYFEKLDMVIESPEDYRLTEQHIADVWHYAYRFFFEFTKPFPWHLLYFWDDVEEWPVKRVMGEEGQKLFGDTFRVFAGEPLDWSVVT